LEEVRPTSPESPLALTFGVALLKGEKFDLVIQKAAELGVNRIIPLETDRADVKLADKHDGFKRVTRWQRIALEAAKQSGRAQVPEICVPQSLTSGLASMKEQSGDGTLRLMFSERDGESFTQACSSVSEPPAAVVLVGPEGGWTDNEIHAARTAGFKVVTLQGRTLRAETAAIVVATLMQHRFGDLS
jgi:16S rRNA (uracil1498-N3)-methyltransferase